MKIFAHRGASAQFPENTLLAFEAASKLAIEGVELDVQRTKDGVLVVNHDEKIHRTSNGSGYLLDHTFEQLRQLDFGSWKGEQFAGTQIPTLEEVLRIFLHTHHIINIELKTDKLAYVGIEDEVIALVESLNMSDRVMYSSFDHLMVEKLLKKAPTVETAALFENVLIHLHEYGENLGTNALHVSMVAAKRGVMAPSIEKGSHFRVYTVNKQSDYDEMERLGAEAIFTDYAEQMLEHRQSKSKNEVVR